MWFKLRSGVDRVQSRVVLGIRALDLVTFTQGPAASTRTNDVIGCGLPVIKVVIQYADQTHRT